LPTAPRSTAVIIPAYNAAATIQACVQSALALSSESAPIEILVVDDASTDETASLAKAAGATVIEQATNGGAAAARNIGVQHTECEFLAFLDADCEIPEDWLGKCFEAWDEKRYSALTGPYFRSGSPGVLPELVHRFTTFNQQETPDEVISAISANLLVKRTTFLQAGGFPEYNLPWSKQGYYVNEDDVLAYFLFEATQKPLHWMSDNGVIHHYRATLGALFRQQFGWTESILITYARFPGMLWIESHYSRSSGASVVLLCVLLYLSLVLAAITGSSLFLAGALPFFWLNLPAARELSGSQPKLGWLRAMAFLLWVTTAWTAGLISGAIKGPVAFLIWKWTDPTHGRTTGPC
jgi:glycosyltransferase involved in cell wall biosynthesis